MSAAPQQYAHDAVELDTINTRYSKSTEWSRLLLLGLFFISMSLFCHDARPPLFLAPRVALGFVELAYHRHVCVVCGCGSIWHIKKCTLTTPTTTVGATATTAVVLLRCACVLCSNGVEPAVHYVRVRMVVLLPMV